MAKRDCVTRGKYALSYDGMRKALRRQGAVKVDYAQGELESLDATERNAAGRFVRQNDKREWCVSKWRQEIGTAIGRNCHTIPFQDVREILHANMVRPVKLPSVHLDANSASNGGIVIHEQTQAERISGKLRK